jgi:hypothetical protein
MIVKRSDGVVEHQIQIPLLGRAWSAARDGLARRVLFVAWNIDAIGCFRLRAALVGRS